MFIRIALCHCQDDYISAQTAGGSCLQLHMNMGMCFNTQYLTSFYNDQVQKRVQIRMDALQKYIDTILENACKLVTEQFASSGFSISDPDLPELSPGGVMCGPNDTLSSSVFNQLSVSSIDSHSPGGKPSPSGIEGPPLLLQKSPELKRRSSWAVSTEYGCSTDFLVFVSNVEYHSDKWNCSTSLVVADLCSC